EAGAKVIIWDLLDVAAETAKEFGAEFMKISVTEPGQVQDAVADIATRYGKIDILVNNAGILRDRSLLKMSHQEWQQVIDVNLTGVFLCGREAATQMTKHQKSGVIINISSISRAGNPGQSNYAAAKAGVAALTTTWARELARFNIRSVAIAPGVFETEMVASMKPEAYERITSAIPLKRTGSLTELSQTINFLIENDYVNGRVIELDGGLRL
ncbi:MAG: SDR family oxidoreductase, partial [Pseudomonadota bacterium]